MSFLSLKLNKTNNQNLYKACRSEQGLETEFNWKKETIVQSIVSVGARGASGHTFALLADGYGFHSKLRFFLPKSANTNPLF